MKQSNLFEYLKNSNNSDIFIVNNQKDAKKAKVVFDYLGVKSITLPDIRLSFGEDCRSSWQDIAKLFFNLKKFYSGGYKLIAPFRTLTLPLPKEEYLQTIDIEFASTINIEELKETLYNWGYSFVDIVSAPLEVSFRGDIIDIFPINYENPIRVSLFDNEVEEIRYFDISTQKRLNDDIESITIPPAFLSLNREEYKTLQAKVEESQFNTIFKDIISLGLWHLDEFSFNIFDKYNPIYCSNLNSEIDEFFEFNRQNFDFRKYNINTIAPSREYRDLEVVDINALIKANRDKKITIIARNQSVARGSGLIDIESLEFKYIDGILNIGSNKELILSINREKRKARVKKSRLILDEIRVGEYVVHENYGVGIFRGVQKRQVLGRMRDFVAIEYKDEDMLYIPVENLEVIDRYVAASGSLPTLDKLGKQSFGKLKEKVKTKLFAIAKDLMELSAKRLLNEGKKIVVNREIQEIFLKEAGFTHTDDQLRAIDEILEDLSSGKVMDRLLSADVGFGKTEVAMNAIFAVVKSGYQAAIVAPTTLLSMQHFKSLQDRFKKWDINVAKFDRFTTAKEKRLIKEGLLNGTIDVVVGTHGVANLEFNNLALVIIDEEHKFGVKQKEALKRLTINTHLLSMSATPIPRSLNMALSHIKSFSEIFTPPVDRVGVKSFVKNYDIKIVSEAIRRELRRGGQVFYIYNSIASIESKKDEILEELPNLRVAILHSKIGASQSEKIMLKFALGEYDMLISTSIVESGIHLPNANTIIIDGAERFGIADLHQLRGRVGRGSVQGYCYFLVEDKDALKENALKRLLALESHSELGSGAVLAMHDLEIRGGGNLVGEAQSGHIKQIGYSLYLKMLEDAIRTLSGKVEDKKREVEIKLNIDAYLNEELINEDRLRLELYRRFAKCQSLEDVYEIEEEIEDRFGKIDKYTRQYIDLIVVKVLALQKDIKKVSSFEDNIYIEFNNDRDKLTMKSPTKDSDDILATTINALKKI